MLNSECLRNVGDQDNAQQDIEVSSSRENSTRRGVQRRFSRKVESTTKGNCLTAYLNKFLPKEGSHTLHLSSETGRGISSPLFKMKKLMQPEESRSEASSPNNRTFSPSVFRRLTLSRGKGSSPLVYSDADAWLTDSIANGSSSSSDLRGSRILRLKKTSLRGRPRTEDGSWKGRRSAHRPSVFSRLSLPSGTYQAHTNAESKGPRVGPYQLLGDSLFVRFADQVLKSPAVIGANGKFTNGHCVSGQTIRDLDRRISSDFITSDVIVLIGTNNFLQNQSLCSMRGEMEKLLYILSGCVDKVVLLTIPPIPRLEKSSEFWEKWENYNKWLQLKDNGSSVKVIDVASLFLLKPLTPDMSAFESFMGAGSRKREDKIHLNIVGLLRLDAALREQLKID